MKEKLNKEFFIGMIGILLLTFIVFGTNVVGCVVDKYQYKCLSEEEKEFQDSQLVVIDCKVQGGTPNCYWDDCECECPEGKFFNEDNICELK